MQTTFDVEHSCGRTVSAHFGHVTTGRRLREVEQARPAGRAAAGVQVQAAGLPALTGTPRDIERAEPLRAATTNAVELWIRHGQATEEGSAGVLAQTDTRWWITFGQLPARAYKAANTRPGAAGADVSTTLENSR